MISPPQKRRKSEISKIEKISNEPEVLEYTDGFCLQEMEPSNGDIFTFFIHESYFDFQHPGISDRNIYGNVHYTIGSDLVAVAMHTGVLFIDPKYKESSHKIFCSTSNIFETMCCSDVEYKKRAITYVIPNDVRIKGIVISILICGSPSVFISTNRNGVRSRECTKEDLSFRISNFYILSEFDEMPRIVKKNEYVRDCAVTPSCQLSFTNEIGFKFTKYTFSQFFNVINVINGFFNAYRLFFDVKDERYEIELCYDVCGFCFNVIKIITPNSLEILRRKQSKIVEKEIIVENTELFNIKVGDDYLNFDGKTFKPVGNFLILCLSSKISRSFH